MPSVAQKFECGKPNFDILNSDQNLLKLSKTFFPFVLTSWIRVGAVDPPWLFTISYPTHTHAGVSTSFEVGGWKMTVGGCD